MLLNCFWSSTWMHRNQISSTRKTTITTTFLHKAASRSCSSTCRTRAVVLRAERSLTTLSSTFSPSVNFKLPSRRIDARIRHIWNKWSSHKRTQRSHPQKSFSGTKWDIWVTRYPLRHLQDNVLKSTLRLEQFISSMANHILLSLLKIVHPCHRYIREEYWCFRATQTSTNEVFDKYYYLSQYNKSQMLITLRFQLVIFSLLPPLKWYGRQYATISCLISILLSTLSPPLSLFTRRLADIKAKQSKTAWSTAAGSKVVIDFRACWTSLNAAVSSIEST